MIPARGRSDDVEYTPDGNEGSDVNAVRIFIHTHGMQRLRPHFDTMQRNLAAHQKCTGEGNIMGTQPLFKDAPWGNDFIMAATHGIDTAVERVKVNMDTCGIIAALLLSSAAPYIVQPPETLSDMSNNDPAKIIFCTATIVTSLACIMIIVFVFQFGIGINKAVRDSDKWMILLASHPRLHMGANDFVINLVWVTTISLLLTHAVSVFGNYGLPATIATGVAAVTTWSLAFVVGLHFMRAGHVNYYWVCRGHTLNDPIVLTAAMNRLERIIKAATASTRISAHGPWGAGASHAC